MSDSNEVMNEVNPSQTGPDSKSLTTETVNDIIRSIGYISLCFSLFLFLTLKIMKYMLSRKKFKFNIENSQNNTPNSITPMLKRSYTP